MKKIISVLMVAVCLMMAAPAQAQLHFGVKGGLNLSKVSFSKSDLKGDNKTGWFIGPMAEFTLPIIGIGADVAALYSQTELAAKGYSTDAKLKTIEIPVNLKWSFGLGSMLGAYIAAGPQFGFNIGNKKGFMNYDLKKKRMIFPRLTASPRMNMSPIRRLRSLMEIPRRVAVVEKETPLLRCLSRDL